MDFIVVRILIDAITWLYLTCINSNVNLLMWSARLDWCSWIYQQVIHLYSWCSIGWKWRPNPQTDTKRTISWRQTCSFVGQRQRQASNSPSIHSNLRWWWHDNHTHCSRRGGCSFVLERRGRRSVPHFHSWHSCPSSWFPFLAFMANFLIPLPHLLAQLVIPVLNFISSFMRFSLTAMPSKT